MTKTAKPNMKTKITTPLQRVFSAEKKARKIILKRNVQSPYNKVKIYLSLLESAYDKNQKSYV